MPTPLIDVLMPDGTIVRDVPRGTTKLDLILRLNKYRAGRQAGAVEHEIEGSSAIGQELVNAPGAFGQDILGALHGLASLGAPPESGAEKLAMLLGPGGMVGRRLVQAQVAATQENKRASDAAAERGEGLKSLLNAAAAGLPLFGPMVGGVIEAAERGEGLGTGASRILQLIGPKGAGEATRGAGRFLSRQLLRSATRQAEAALEPSGQAAKFTTRKVARGMVEQRVSGSLEGIEGQAEGKIAALAPEIEAEVRAIPKAKGRAEATRAMEALEQSKRKLTVNGVAADRAAIGRITQLQKDIRALGQNVSPESLNQFRRIWDERVAQGKGYQGKTLAEGAELEVQRTAADAVRRALADDSPSLAKLNGEMHFWKQVQGLTREAVLRKTGRQGLRVTELAVGGGGAAFGIGFGDPLSAVGLGLGAPLLVRAMRSAMWRTTSAALKGRLADALMKGDAATVNRLSLLILAGRITEGSDRGRPNQIQEPAQ